MSSMAYNAAAGLPGMLKAGTRHLQDSGGDASVVLQNIDACLQLSRSMLTSSLGPQGRCKLVVNHLGKIMVTADCAAILQQVQIQHPAASLLSMTVQKQKTECGDATNFCLSFAGELLYQTAMLIKKMTWHQTAPEIIAGYQRAVQMITQEFLPSTVAETVSDFGNKQELLKLITPVLQSKQYGAEQVLGPLVADACLMVYPAGSKGAFPASSIRTVPILGAGSAQSRLIQGYVATRGLETVRQSATDCKIAVFASGIEASSTEAKGTVVMNTAEDLMTYNKSEETKMKEIILGLKEADITVIVSGGAVSDMALHFMDQYDLVCLRCSSKWELRRLCQAVGATALVRLGTPLPEEMGYAVSVQQEELGDKTVTVFTGAAGDDGSQLATIVLRAFTKTLLADLERAVDDGVQVVAQAVKDNGSNPGGARLCYGGGCTEMAWSVQLQQAAQKVPGLQQYAMQAFARALWVVPRTLAENAGHANASISLAHLQAAHASNIPNCDMGIDIEATEATATGICSMKAKGILDLLANKRSALVLAVDTVTTILKIDQIIMSKQAGGPK